MIEFVNGSVKSTRLRQLKVHELKVIVLCLVFVSYKMFSLGLIGYTQRLLYWKPVREEHNYSISYLCLTNIVLYSISISFLLKNLIVTLRDVFL